VSFSSFQILAYLLFALLKQTVIMHDISIYRDPDIWNGILIGERYGVSDRRILLSKNNLYRE